MAVPMLIQCYPSPPLKKAGKLIVIITTSCITSLSCESEALRMSRLEGSSNNRNTSVSYMLPFPFLCVCAVSLNVVDVFPSMIRKCRSGSGKRAENKTSSLIKKREKKGRR